ncbi:phosphatidylglycerophosphatase A [uncultured Traorella sp.]|uniref:phosphatidylglycerophosphatase A family protein n=1 Tax=uncultured Traorella sp. TaxID=1929048 RepID=UPI0025DCBA62|nr:phosphatidylglycerophosphatase A [uncultured Traorella sp.]
MKELCVRLLNERGVELKDIAECVVFLQSKYYPQLNVEMALEGVEAVLDKREVQNAILTGIFLDKSAEKGMIEGPLSEMLLKDEGLYGIDEVLAYGICNLYGSIALTNYGYIDKVKPLIINKLNSKGKQCNTFLDDIVGAIAASAASRLAHNR